MAKQRLKAVILALALSLFLLYFCVFTVNATPPDKIILFYDNASAVVTDLDISGTTATIYAGLTGNSKTKSIKVTYSLQKKSGSSWRAVKSWSGSATGIEFSAEKTYDSLVYGTQYRVYAKFTVTAKDGSKETITDYSSTYTC
ncbi:MAG TPA: hypothetical protein DEQ02_07230 [Ruminococcaceae bacterium]|nr:hypothetical protein [Oscillospiraceae bacterium]